jgi:tetratricopeptide (TPR) repeat protein
MARVRTAAGEFNTAEDLLRRAVKLSPEFAEARLHLGRVLAEQEQHKESLPELTRALSVIKNLDLQYFGQLFVGRSAAALGQIPAAREAFERAVALRPAAQSPLLALSQLAYSRGDSGEAAARLARVAELPGLELDDPWWIYNTAVGRFFGPSHQEIAEDLRKEMPR